MQLIVNNICEYEMTSKFVLVYLWQNNARHDCKTYKRTTVNWNQSNAKHLQRDHIIRFVICMDYDKRVETNYRLLPSSELVLPNPSSISTTKS